LIPLYRPRSLVARPQSGMWTRRVSQSVAYVCTPVPGTLTRSKSATSTKQGGAVIPPPCYCATICAPASQHGGVVRLEARQLDANPRARRPGNDGRHPNCSSAQFLCRHVRLGPVVLPNSPGSIAGSNSDHRFAGFHIHARQQSSLRDVSPPAAIPIAPEYRRWRRSDVHGKRPVWSAKIEQTDVSALPCHFLTVASFRSC